MHDRETSHGDMQTIEAVRFEPSDARSSTSKFQLWHGLLLVAAMLALFIFWFIFTTRSVTLLFDPPAESISISGGLSFELAEVTLLREGPYTLTATAELHEPLIETIDVDASASQSFEFKFTPLPGFLTITTIPEDADITVDGKPANGKIELPAGEHEVGVTHPRYQGRGDIIDIVGRREEQSLSMELAPNWADVTVTSEPTGATVYIDGDAWHTLTPAVVEALSGEREIEIRMDGFRSHRQRIFAQAEQPMRLATVKLEQADAQLNVTSTPSGAGVLINGRFSGQTPLQLDLKSGQLHTVQLIKAGYTTQLSRIKMKRGQHEALSITLPRQKGVVQITATPAEAELWVDGAHSGSVNRALTLPVRAHDIEIKMQGYASYRQTITPKVGLTQEIKVKLLSLAEARLAAMKPSIRAPDGQTLLLFEPEDFTMGASRREPGRRANETLRDVSMTRIFYLATHETTNKQFRTFASGHDTGKYVETSLNDDLQPVANLSWHDAAAYCNWLSEQEGLPRFYDLQFGKVVGTYPSATGYRLPTEAEWTWAARTFSSQSGSEPQPQLRFPWGSNLPPPERHGNYADRAASALVGRVVFGYNDNYAAAAPVGTYKANHRGLYDMGGNIAEWVNDFYEIPDKTTVQDPTGPTTGEYHVIKGSGWMHGTITELRLSFRDYGIDGRQDVGFRIARYVEVSN